MVAGINKNDSNYSVFIMHSQSFSLITSKKYVKLRCRNFQIQFQQFPKIEL